MAKDYQLRINRAVDHIQNNLANALNLESVAQVAAFSKYHFHRIFTNYTGESLNQFILRSRLERCLFLLSHAETRSLTDISDACGFATQAEMSRAFKRRFGVSPQNFDLEDYRNNHRSALVDKLSDEIRAEVSEEISDNLSNMENSPHVAGSMSPKNPDVFKAVIRRLPQRRMAYNRVWDPYRMDVVPQAAKELVEWAQSVGCGDAPFYGYMWEDPELVAPEKCRYDVAVEVQPDVHIGENFSEVIFPEMTVAELSICGDIDLEQRGIDWLYGQWLPSSNYEPDNLPAFECWRGLPFEHGMEHFELSLQLPVLRR